MVDLRKIYGGCMVDVWWIYGGGFMEGLWWSYGGFMAPEDLEFHYTRNIPEPQNPPEIQQTNLNSTRHIPQQENPRETHQKST